MGGKGRDKVARGDAVEDFTKGGLGFPDIPNSWAAFKFSWLRRLWDGKGLWVELFKEAVKQITLIADIKSFICNIKMVKINKNINKVKNPFWISVLKEISPLWTAFQRKHKESLGDANIFGSSYLIPEGGLLLPENFPNMR